MEPKYSDEILALKTGHIYTDVYNKRVDFKRANSYADLKTAEIIGNELVFDSEKSFIKAITDGIFYLKIPESMDISECISLSQGFYKEKNEHKHGGYRKINPSMFDDPRLGFHKRVNQIEQFILGRKYWKNIYPNQVVKIAEELINIGVNILNSVLIRTDIDEKYWREATGGCSISKGAYHFVFNHYRSEYPEIGLASHKDDGFITILHSTAEGLEINRCDRWEKVMPRLDYFIINFGLPMELLTKNSSLVVKAILHRVDHQIKDRCSFAHFTSNNYDDETDCGVYSYSPNTGISRLCNAHDLIDSNNHETYHGTVPPGEDIV